MSYDVHCRTIHPGDTVRVVDDREELSGETGTAEQLYEDGIMTVAFIRDHGEIYADFSPESQLERIDR